MPTFISWEQIALRLTLALVASFLIGYDRDEHGKTSGIRTTMLVCLAATLAMLQTNLLMNSTGKSSDSFVVLDLMRLPLGILSGIGFIGAGAILRKDGLVHGLTTAATLWFVTILGLLFGGGQLILAITATAIALFILWVLKRLEKHLPTHRTGTLYLALAATRTTPTSLQETELRTLFHNAGYTISGWTAHYTEAALSSLICELRWPSSGAVESSTPSAIHELAALTSITSLTWKS
jgi:putative Mg2+ transporter-C (MgtC) family protein